MMHQSKMRRSVHQQLPTIKIGAPTIRPLKDWCTNNASPQRLVHRQCLPSKIGAPTIPPLKDWCTNNTSPQRLVHQQHLPSKIGAPTIRPLKDWCTNNTSPQRLVHQQYLPLKIGAPTIPTLKDQEINLRASLNDSGPCSETVERLLIDCPRWKDLLDALWAAIGPHTTNLLHRVAPSSARLSTLLLGGGFNQLPDDVPSELSGFRSKAPRT